MTNSTIICPSCKTEIEITSAVARQVRAELAAEFAAKQRDLETAHLQREKELADRATQLEKERLSLDQRLQEKLQLERLRIVADARKQAQNEIALQFNDLQEQLKSRDAKLAEAQKAQLEFIRKERDLAERERELELELQKKLRQETEKLQAQAREFALSEFNLKIEDKEKTIAELRRQIEQLNLKASKTSQQLQGEVLEEKFETMLRQTFPHDQITPVKTGAHGADLLQKVCTPDGAHCGAILWEVKRTAAFQKSWINKLKDDQRAESADFAVILTQAMPDDCEHFQHRDGVWITAYHCGLGLALALRQGLVQLGAARRAAANQKEKTGAVYHYLCSLEFRQTIEALVGNYLALRKNLAQERAAMEKLWAARAKQLEALICNAASVYGSVQGIIGAAALPDIPALTLEPAAPLLEE